MKRVMVFVVALLALAGIVYYILRLTGSSEQEE